MTSLVLNSWAQVNKVLLQPCYKKVHTVSCMKTDKLLKETFHIFKPLNIAPDKVLFFQPQSTDILSYFTTKTYGYWECRNFFCGDKNKMSWIPSLIWSYA